MGLTPKRANPFDASNAIREKRHREEGHADEPTAPVERKPLPGRRALPVAMPAPVPVPRPKDPNAPHVRERESHRWRQWKRGRGTCAACGRDWVPREGRGLLLPHFTAFDVKCPSRQAK